MMMRARTTTNDNSCLQQRALSSYAQRENVNICAGFSLHYEYFIMNLKAMISN